ncbi:hypothetical protein LCL95_15000 [Bacillus timonensis]|nr:hypothetical protein [Bacillus timonensis]
MSSDIFFNPNTSAPHVYRPYNGSETTKSNQHFFYSSFIKNQLNFQKKYNDKVSKYITSTHTLYSNWQKAQGMLEAQLDHYVKTQRELTEKMNEQFEQQEVVQNHMEDQKKVNLEIDKKSREQNEEMRQLHQLIKRQVEFNQKISESIIDVKEHYEGLDKFIKSQEEILLNYVKKQESILEEMMQSAKENKEQNKILLECMKKQEHFNYKIFEFLCTQFDKMEEHSKETFPYRY